jgi:outer membrane biosynthesis protein TonB
MRLRLDIDPHGQVKHVRLIATQTLPALLTECVEEIAERWRFQPPGAAGITFEAPVSFRPVQ